jgi:hypothetical protein
MSAALSSLSIALLEIADLERANPTPIGKAPLEPKITRAIGRSAVVLLSSHFERYLYSVNEEAVAFVNSVGVTGDLIPEKMRLLHSMQSIDDLAVTGWEKRSRKLEQLIECDGWLWKSAQNGQLDHKRLLAWMKSPKPESIVRYYAYWELKDIFKEITSTPHTRSNLWLRLDELVQKRNNIAHGDHSAEATSGDVQQYVWAVKTFCDRADRRLSKQVSMLLRCSRPW